jgi:hypothetical protein
MQTSKFRIGDDVNFTSGTVGRPATTKFYTVVRVLPLEGREQQYRIKTDSEAHERVANESQLDLRA